MSRPVNRENSSGRSSVKSSEKSSEKSMEKSGGNALSSFSVDGSDISDQRHVRFRLNEPGGTSTLSSTL